MNSKVRLPIRIIAGIVVLPFLALLIFAVVGLLLGDGFEFDVTFFISVFAVIGLLTIVITGSVPKRSESDGK
ncbi:hypothetical protein [Glaciecola sp. 33A]|jgi:hypothetical protein|uniref:hypothetical protein n=1 Tax=Glaciecola sp. 33A TaxID=2057807 RepID=UPI000C32D591|nr:hypothetical protein [Glaciecola sp. 33A]PKI02695.1 hypothetical protein CXF81_04935 [Glaciecola sp. 33A]